MARKEKDIATQNLVITDPETGKELTFTAEHTASLAAAKHQVKAGLATVAVALKTIRDQKLYLIENCGSMREWLLENFQSSYTTFKNLVAVADRFAEAPDADMVLSQPITHLLLYSKHEQTADGIADGSIQFSGGKVILEDGTEISAKDFAKQIRTELKKETAEEVKKLDHKLKTNAAKLSAKDSLIESMQEDLGKLRLRAAELEKAITESKDIDPSRLVYVTQKHEAVSLLVDTTTQVLALIGRMDTLPEALVGDAEVAGNFSRSLSAIEAGLERIRQHWGSTIWTPREAGDLPTDDLTP
jgi:hypothetical protein